MIKKLLFIFTVLVFAAAANVSAQNVSEPDPRHKSDLWAQLEENPNSQQVWAEYMGKSWNRMSYGERKLVMFWRRKLSIRKKAQENYAAYAQPAPSREDLETSARKTKVSSEAMSRTQNSARTESSANPSDSEVSPTALPSGKQQVEKAKISETQVKQLEILKNAMLSDSPEMKDLKSNVEQNFFIIEERYAEIFSRYGVRYRTYDDVHPDGEYKRVRWVEETDRRIRELKTEEVNKIFARYDYR